MSFLEPIALAFAAALPVVILLYLLKRRRVVKLTSSTLLWQRFLAESQANAPFQKLRNNWLLLLQLLLLALVILAIARPFLEGSARQSRLRVLVLDASASMQSTDEAPTRFEHAKSEALKWIDGLQDNEQMMILLAASNTEVKQSPTRDKPALRRALASCQPSDGPTRLVEALQTASAFTYEKKGEELTVSGEIHLFSDGAAVDLGELGNKNLPLVYHRVGRRGGNLGIVSLDIRANPENPAERALFAGIANASAEARSVQIELQFNRQVLEVRTVEIPATNSLPLILIARQETDGLFTLKLNATDDLAADNQASIYSILPRPIQVLLVTRGDRFLEKALRGTPNAQITTATQLSSPAGNYDVVVLDDVQPLLWPDANVLAIRVAGTNWFEESASEKTPAIVDWHHTHPLLRYVNFDNVDVAESILPKLPPWGISLVQSQQRPLLVAGERERRRIVWMGFDPLQSNWPLRISFPIFIANAMDWLNPSLSRSADLLVRAGDPFRYLPRDPVDNAEVTLPDGTRQALTLTPGSREILFMGTQKQGTYQLRAGTNHVTFCVNLLDAAESNTTPRDELPLGKYAGAIGNSVKTASVELWRWPAAIGLLVLLFEWWFYHRRTA